MSLINQVLKDLERRHAAEMAEATHNLDGLALASPVLASSRRKKIWLLPVFALILLACGAGATWWWQQLRTAPLQSASSPATPAGETAAIPDAKPGTAQLGKPVATASSHLAAVKSASAKPASAAPVQKQEVSTGVRKHAPSQAMADDTETAKFEKQRVPLRSEEKAEMAYQAAYAQVQQHNVREAEKELRRALTLEPRHVRARELLAGLLIKQGRWVETSELLQQGVQLVPAHAVFIKLYARSLMQLERDPQAIAVLREHAPPLAQDPDYHALLAALYQRSQNHPAAATTYNEILKLRPDAGIWWVGLGISLEAMGKQKEAQQAYARARQSGSLHGDLARYTDNRLLALAAVRYPNE